MKKSKSINITDTDALLELSKVIMRSPEIPQEFTMDTLMDNINLRMSLRSQYMGYSMYDVAIKLLNKKDSVTMEEVKSAFDTINLYDIMDQYEL